MIKVFLYTVNDRIEKVEGDEVAEKKEESRKRDRVDGICYTSCQH